MRAALPTHPGALAARQIGLVLLAIIAAWLGSRFLLYPWLGLPDNAPMILRPILGFAAAWIVLRLAGERWAEFGLARPPSLPFLLLATALLYALVWALNRFLVPELAAWLQFRGGPSILGYLQGNTVAFLGWLAISWLVGGFCEELLFRGFLLNKVATLCGGQGIGLAVGVIAQAVLFGLLHLYQGGFGFVFAFTMASAFGVGYLACRRNLWPLILVHGSWNSLAIYGIYSA